MTKETTIVAIKVRGQMKILCFFNISFCLLFHLLSPFCCLFFESLSFSFHSLFFPFSLSLFRLCVSMSVSYFCFERRFYQDQTTFYIFRFSFCLFGSYFSKSLFFVVLYSISFIPRIPHIYQIKYSCYDNCTNNIFVYQLLLVVFLLSVTLLFSELLLLIMFTF